jgi:hypothetical protein
MSPYRLPGRIEAKFSVWNHSGSSSHQDGFRDPDGLGIGWLLMIIFFIFLAIAAWTGKS